MNLPWNYRIFSTSLRMSILQPARSISAGWFIGLHVMGPVFFLLTSWTISQMVPNVQSFVTATGINDYLSFAIIGFAFQGIVLNAAWTGANAIRFEQEMGTAELIFLTPANKVLWILGKMAGGQLFSLLSTAVILVFGSLTFGLHPKNTPDVPTAILGVLGTIAGMSAFGFVMAGMTFALKRAEDVNQVLWPIMIFFCGLAFPIEALPQPVQLISWIFPITPGLDITRKAILLGSGLSSPIIANRFLILLLQIAVMLPIGLIAFSRFVRNAQRTGTLATY